MSYTPIVFNVFKPAGVTSYDVIRHFKRNLAPGFGKIGHMGTLDPFAAGVLLVAVSGATRINDYVHSFLPKTYLAVGKLGVWTETGDMTIPVQQYDKSSYLTDNIATFSSEFIQQQLQDKFIGEYLQTPPVYSATKFQGKALHRWKREDGIEIKKEAVRRTIYNLEVVRYSFPFLSIRVTASSGTYIRTLFQDAVNHLGTIGSLTALVRESIGQESIDKSLRQKCWPKKDSGFRDDYHHQYGVRVDQLLPLQNVLLAGMELTKYQNGNPVSLSANSIEGDHDGISCENMLWVYSADDFSTRQIVGLGKITPDRHFVQPVINFPVKR